jgi:hypothetical protein
MSMFYKLASAVLARTTGRAVVAMRFRRKIHCAFGARRFVAVLARGDTSFFLAKTVLFV